MVNQHFPRPLVSTSTGVANSGVAGDCNAGLFNRDFAGKALERVRRKYADNHLAIAAAILHNGAVGGITNERRQPHGTH